MLKKVLWLALGCAVLLAALAVSRQVRFTGQKETEKAPAAEEAAKPAVATAPKSLEVVPEPTPEELQMEEDAAATGMTTVEPEPEPEPEAERAPAPSDPPAETPPT